jgi:hypothetical protein
MICNDFDAALDWAMKALAVNANWNPTYWMLVAANAHLGRMEPASRYLKHLLELVPGVTIDAIRSGQPSYDPERRAAIYKGLQIAGLPD